MKKTLALVAAALVSACSGSDKTTDIPPGPGEPNDTIDTATAMTPGTPVAAQITQGYDDDFYKFTLATAAVVHVQTFGANGATCGDANDIVDTTVDVFDGTKAHIGHWDDTYSNSTFVDFCESFNVQLEAGENYVMVSGIPPYPVNYTLSVTIP